jgi:hypothetical protein
MSEATKFMKRGTPKHERSVTGLPKTAGSCEQMFGRERGQRFIMLRRSGFDTVCVPGHDRIDIEMSPAPFTH